MDDIEVRNKMQKKSLWSDIPVSICSSQTLNTSDKMGKRERQLCLLTCLGGFILLQSKMSYEIGILVK